MNASHDKTEVEKAPTSNVDVVAVAVETTSGITRIARTGVGVWILVLLALVAALHLARELVVPLLFGILVSYALRPVVDWLDRWHIPRVVGAGCLLAVLVGGVSWLVFSLSGDAAAMIEKLPDAARKLRHSLVTAYTGSPTALQHVKEAADELQGAAADAGLKSTGSGTAVIEKPEPIAWLRNFMLAQFALLAAFAAQAPIVLLLTYFLLASGTHFRRKLVQFVGPSLTRKKDAVRILEEVDAQVQRYLLVMLISNTLVGVLTWLAFEMLGLEHAGIWGATAGILRFIPYLGTVTIALASGVAGFLQFESLPPALGVAGSFLLIASAVGMVFTTWLQGRFAGVNPAVLFIVLLFFAWLWGMAGLLLGAPLIAIVKVVCDGVESLKRVGELLGR
ncbi:Predicted PurR-regulated permease PerM [Nitrosospira sp. Nl5]|uniref:AI-2E family transporter n=1 Tax=Nitrosospira sp. Nl5 TaxID=200120 RepID=UPI00087F94CE|nr:AI-2E family transporter [Nitrosospira sp. Nl5]SCY61217.1 Predicted PurR-regulated permease PerM [Nitrosospira sp. Nl5]